jgi:AAA domain
MTRFDPNLRVERLIVSAQGEIVYDEVFHLGLNIIRGENSSGKSTVMDFVFFGLGGDLSDWRETALKCQTVILGVVLNGQRATFWRDISETQNGPMRIF